MNYLCNYILYNMNYSYNIYYILDTVQYGFFKRRSSEVDDCGLFYVII